MYKVQFKFMIMGVFPCWQTVPQLLKTRKEAETMVECVFEQKHPNVTDVRIVKI